MTLGSTSKGCSRTSYSGSAKMCQDSRPQVSASPRGPIMTPIDTDDKVVKRETAPPTGCVELLSPQPDP